MRSKPPLRAFAVLAAVLACLLISLPVTLIHAAPSPAGAVGGTWGRVEQPPLAGQPITALLPDGPSGIWVGTEERGLARWDGASWRRLSTADGLPDDRIIALFADRQQHLWISTGTALVYLPSGGNAPRRVPLKGLPGLPVLSIGQAQDGGILLGGPSGAAIWQPDGALRLIPELAGKRVNAIHTARTGVTWVGTSAGLWRSAGLGWQHDEQVSAGVAALAEGPDGRLFLASESGAWELVGDKWTLVQPGTRGQFMRASVHDGALWLGGPDGLTAGQAGVWRTYDPRPLPDPTVSALAWTHDGRLWVGTRNGLTRFEPDTAAPRIAIHSINGSALPAGPLSLQLDHLDRLVLAAEDAATPGSPVTPSNQLRYFVRLDGVDAAPRLLTPAEAADPLGVSVYAGRRLSAGTHVLRAWAEDDTFNRSPEAQVTVVVPALIHLPGGLALPAAAGYTGLASAALLLTAGATARLARQARRRQLTRVREAAAIQVRAAFARSPELYAASVPLRQQQVQEALAALPSRSVLLLGAQGMGKSATLDEIASALSDAAGQGSHAQSLLPAPLDLALVPEADFFAALMAAATRALYPLVAGAHPRLAWNEGAAVRYTEQQFSTDLGVLLAWLQAQRAERLLLVFLLDNASLLDSYAGPLRDAVRRLIVACSAASSPVRLLLAAERRPGLIEGFDDLFRAVELLPLSDAAADQLLRQGARGLVDWEPEAASLAIRRAEGSPGRLVALAKSAALAALANGRLAVSPADIPAAHGP